MVLWPLNDVYLLECSLGFMDTFLKIEHGRSDRLSFPILGYKKKTVAFVLDVCSPFLLNCMLLEENSYMS